MRLGCFVPLPKATTQVGQATTRYESGRGVDDEVVMLGLGLVDFVEVVFHSDVEFGFVIEPIGRVNYTVK